MAEQISEGWQAGMYWLKAFAVWLLLMGAEVVHGMLRTLILAPMVGDFRSRQIGVFTGSIIILAIVFLSIRWMGIRKKALLLAIGLMFLLFTLFFEISLGHLVFGYTWKRIAEDFNITSGGLLPFGLLILLLSPLIAARFRNSHESIHNKKQAT